MGLSTAIVGSEARRGRLPELELLLAQVMVGMQGDDEARGDLPGGSEGKRGTEVDEGN